jgi:hypothetical protein
MDTLTDYLVEARAAWLRGDWRASRAAYVRVDGLGPMPLDDLDAYASATWRLGYGQEAVRLAERVYDRLVRTDPGAAARKAADVALEWRTRGHEVVARVWADRARVLLVREAPGEVVGILAYLDASAAVTTIDREALGEAANVLSHNVIQTSDVTLSVLGQVVAGLVALVDARTDEGVDLLDAVLLPVIDERVPLEWAGDVYRTVLGPAAALADAVHVAEWATSLRSWCEMRGLAAELVIGPWR